MLTDFFISEVAFKQKWITVSEVEQRREGGYAVSFSKHRVSNLNHVDSVHVTLIVNFFQLHQNAVTGTTRLFI